MSSVVEARPKGWRPDPSGRYEWRYWDGGWTNRVANSATPVKPPTSPGHPQPSQAPQPASAPTPTPIGPPRAIAAASPVDGAPYTGPPPSASELAVMQAVAGGRPPLSGPKTRAALPAPQYESFEHPVREPRSGLLATVGRWFRAFEDEPESYHSPKAGVALPPHPDQSSILASTPANYGRAGLVALAACGLGVGAYLPWLSGTIDAIPFERTGFELGKASGFTWLAAALALAAILGVRMRPLRWANMALAIAAAVLTANELVDIHRLVTNMNAAAVVRADVGIGLWIMLVSAAGALIASFRIGAPD
jgi:hypothetical protein